MSLTIQEVAKIYQDACWMHTCAENAVEKVIRTAKAHGYTEEQLVAELGWPSRKAPEPKCAL